MGKFMISLSDELEEKLRAEIKEQYHGRIGGLSIFFEKMCRDYLQQLEELRKLAKKRK